MFALYQFSISYIHCPTIVFSMPLNYSCSYCGDCSTRSNWRCQAAHKDTWQRKNRVPELTAAWFRLLMHGLDSSDSSNTTTLFNPNYILYIISSMTKYDYWGRNGLLDIIVKNLRRGAEVSWSLMISSYLHGYKPTFFFFTKCMGKTWSRMTQSANTFLLNLFNNWSPFY